MKSSLNPEHFQVFLFCCNSCWIGLCGGDFHGIKIGIETILSLQVSAAFFNLLSSSSFTRTTGTPRGGVGRFGDGSRDHHRF